jgi:hypothetical protein
MTSLTVANSAFTLEVPDVPLLASGVFILGYTADDAFDADSLAPNEVMTGVDARLSGGWVYVPTKLKFTLQADSPSVLYIDTWYESMGADKESFTANATIVSPALGKIWTFGRGFLTGYKPMPQGKKLFQAQAYEITFERKITAAA